MGSSRVDGHSHQIAKAIQQIIPADRVDLASLSIGPYTYDHRHRSDDFIPLVKKILDYESVILLTPVYWYSMSGLMKTFLDRITDCLQIEKDLGSQLRGKDMVCVSCGAEIEGFFIPFEQSAEYLGMNYLGHLRTWISQDHLAADVESEIVVFFKNRFA